MSHYRRATASGSSYFFTLVSYRRQPILCDDTIRTALREAIETVRAKQPFAIDAWVLLPDHLHCVWTLPTGDADFSTRWMKIKRAVSIAARDGYRNPDLLTASKIRHRESTIWQRRFWEHQIRDESDFSNHLDYLHFNPIKHGHVKSAASWPYSTFHRYVKQGVYPENWGGVVDDFKIQYD